MRTQATETLQALRAGVVAFSQSNYRFPVSLEEVVADGFLTDAKLLVDPWGSPYAYREHQISGFKDVVIAGALSHELLTYGADGAPGGEGGSQDIVVVVEPAFDASSPEAIQAAERETRAREAALDQANAIEWLAEAKDARATPGREHRALYLFGKVEEVMRKEVDAAHKAKDRERIDATVAKYKQLIADYDAVALQLFGGPGLADDLPWTDFLTGPESTKWNPSKGVAGFTVAIVGGTLVITGATPGVKKIGVVSIGDLTPWRDFELEMDFTMVTGAVDILFHLGVLTNQNVLAQPLGVTPTKDNPTPNLVPNTPYVLRARLVGSTLTFGITGAGAPTPKTIPFGWTYYRKGALGFQVEPGTTLLITKFRVRALR